MRLSWYFIVAAAAGTMAWQAVGGELVKNLKFKILPVNAMNIQLSADRTEAVLPRGAAPDLKGGSRNWDKAWTSGRFTVTYKQAVDYAHALQGGGEWREWLTKTLVPRAATQVKMLCDDKTLYIQIKSTQKRLAELLRNPAKFKRDGAVWTNDNVDVLLTANRNSNEYYQILVDCKGNVYDAHQFRNKMHDAKTWNPDYYKHVSYGRDFWCLTLALPVTQWNLSLKDGAFIDCNIGRVEIFNRENSTMSPVISEFKQADRFCRFWIVRKSDLPEIVSLQMDNPLPGKNTLQVTVSNPGKQSFAGTLVSENVKLPVNIAPGAKKVYSFDCNAEKVGKRLCQVQLLDSKNVAIDQAAGEALVRPPMEVKVSSLEYIEGSSPLHASIVINDLRKNAKLEISCGGKKEVIKAASTVEFDFVPDCSGAAADFKVVLLDGGKVVASDSKKIQISGDPFYE